MQSNIFESGFSGGMNVNGKAMPQWGIVQVQSRAWNQGKQKWNIQRTIKILNVI